MLPPFPAEQYRAELAFDTVKVLCVRGADIPVEVALQDNRSRLYSIVPVRVFGQCDGSEKKGRLPRAGCGRRKSEP